ARESRTSIVFRRGPVFISGPPGQGAIQTDRFGRQVATVAQNLNPAGGGLPEGRPVGAIEGVGRGEYLAVPALDDEQQPGAAAGGDDPLQRLEVFDASLGAAVGELRQSRRAAEMAVLDLHPAGGALEGVRVGLEQDVDAAVDVVADLAAEDRIAGQLRNVAAGNGRLGDAVGVEGVDADGTGVGEFDRLERQRQLAFRVRRAGQPDGKTRRGEAEHGAGVRDVNGRFRSVHEGY